MMKKRYFFILILLSIGFTSTAAADVDINPGLWEITTEMKMPGMSMPPATITQCLTKEDLVPQSSSPNQECEIIDMQTSGNTVRWTMKCSGEGGESIAKGEVTYHGDTYEGTMVMTQAGTDYTMHMTGRRIGECE
jgi:hypothetical protein